MPPRQPDHAPSTLPPAFRRAVELRIATGVDSREALVETFCGLAADMPQWFSGHQTVGSTPVIEAIDTAIARHNADTPHASEQTIALLDALEEFPAHGVVPSFAHGVGETSALEAVSRGVQRLAQAAGDRWATNPVWGYAWSDADDAARLIEHATWAVHYGVFAESGRHTDEAAATVRRVVTAHGFAVVDHDTDTQVMTFGPVEYRMPFHGHGLPSLGDELPD